MDPAFYLPEVPLSAGISTNDSDDDALQCNQDALTDSFGWLIQSILATLAFMLLILKRFCEPRGRRRLWIIWFYDTSKQGLGAMVIHFANVFLASQFRGDPCTWYFVSFLLDSSVGLCIIYLGIRFSQFLAYKTDWTAFNFGYYGKPPEAIAWIGQCGVYVTLMVVEKIFITVIIQADFWDEVRDIILYPIRDPKLKVAVVVLVIPFVINALMFWVVDNFLMRKHLYTSDSNEAGISISADGDIQPKRHPAISDVRYSQLDQQDTSECDVLLGADESLLADTAVIEPGVHRTVVPQTDLL